MTDPGHPVIVTHWLTPGQEGGQEGARPPRG
jgi:hypothetical protein